MSDKLEQYKQVSNPLPQSYSLWPLYGAGLESLGNARPVTSARFYGELGKQWIVALATLHFDCRYLGFANRV